MRLTLAPWLGLELKSLLHQHACHHQAQRWLVPMRADSKKGCRHAMLMPCLCHVDAMITCVCCLRATTEQNISVLGNIHTLNLSYNDNVIHTHPATPCHTLPHPATPCHTLPHPATPCHTLRIIYLYIL